MKETSPNDTVLGRPLRLAFEGGATRDVVLMPFKVREFVPLFPHFDDETRLVATACALAPDEELTPESYEAAATALQEINRPFFAYCARRMEGLNRLPKSPAMEAAMERALREHLNSAGGSPASPPRAG